MHTMLRIETLETLDTKEEGGDSIMELIFDKLESKVGGLNFAKRIRWHLMNKEAKKNTYGGNGT